MKEVEVPSGGANSFWNNFAILLNKHCGTARTGKYNLYACACYINFELIKKFDFSPIQYVYF